MKNLLFILALTLLSCAKEPEPKQPETQPIQYSMKINSSEAYVTSWINSARVLHDFPITGAGIFGFDTSVNDTLQIYISCVEPTTMKWYENGEVVRLESFTAMHDEVFIVICK